MDRPLVYLRASPLEIDMLNASRDGMVALGWAMQSVLGLSTCLSGLACTPTSPAGLSILIGAGAIYSLQNLDAIAYSALEADTTHNIVKQGLSLDPIPLACPAPVTPGFSVVYLVQAAYQEQDISLNSGSVPSAQRKGVCVLSIKTGIAAATGTQVTPAADAGSVGLYAVTVAYGQVSVTAANIATVNGALFITETLTQKISQATADARYISQAAADARYISQATADARYISQAAADARYISQATADARYISQAAADARYISQATADARYFLGSSAGALATMGIGAGLENDGSANLRVKNPVNAKTAQTSYSFAATDRAALVRRSNGGVAMTDILPGATAGVMPASWSTSVVNNDPSASLTISVGAGGGQIDGGSSLVLPAGASVVISSDGQNYWSERGLPPLLVLPAGIVTPGKVAHFAVRTAPAGWLKANGALVSRTTYSDLFAAIGTTFGVGDGATTFALPDLRGEFLRAWDDGRGVDAGRVIATWQDSQNASHVHGMGTSIGYATGLAGAVGGGNYAPIDTLSSGGSESRPRNTALLACIKY
jgi:phage-related tail fiber protein